MKLLYLQIDQSPSTCGVVNEINAKLGKCNEECPYLVTRGPQIDFKTIKCRMSGF